jgi:hypothetical protein
MFSGESENEWKDKRMSRELLRVVRVVLLLVAGWVVFDGDKVWRGGDATLDAFSGERVMP